jgi:hypothetical protein
MLLPLPALAALRTPEFRADLARLNRFAPDDWTWLHRRDGFHQIKPNRGPGPDNPLGQLTTYQFQLGLDTNYTFTQFVQDAGGGTAATAISIVLNGLYPSTTYHFRVTASNATGTTVGNDLTFTTSAATDSDGDGIPNDYETAHALDPNNNADAALDADGDGLTNLQEYRAGTDPRSASSTLRITSIAHTGEDLVVTFPSVFGKLYRVEWAELAGGMWNTLEDNLAGNGASISVNDTEAFDLHQRRLYRVTVLP